MNRKISLSLLLSLIVFSCDEPTTTVTNTVYRDGTILRKVEMEYHKKNLSPKNYQVPVDSTWTLKDSISISEKGDTTRYLFAEKLFRNVDEINMEYLADSGANRAVIRKTTFKSRFRWFKTTFYFSEECGRSLIHGYSPEVFLSDDEIAFMKLPVKVKNELFADSDSTMWLNKRDTIDKKSDEWHIKSIFSEWIGDTGALCASSGKDSIITTILRTHEKSFYEFMDKEVELPEGLRLVVGDSIYEKYETELDSALKISEKKFYRSLSFSDYTLQVVMPGKLLSTNGYTLPDGYTAWAVSGEMFLTSDYIMYAESCQINHWAFVVTVTTLFLLLAFISSRIKKNRDH